MKKHLIFFSFLLFSNVVLAQKLTLEEAVNIALKNNLDIQIAKNTVTANSINNHIGVAGGLPSVSLTATDNQQLITVNQELNSGQKITRDWASGNTMQVGVQASQILYNGMRVQATKQRLEALQHLSEQQLNDQIQNTIADVMLQYYEIVRQQSFAKTLDVALQAARERLNIVTTRKAVGLGSNVEVYQTQIDVNNIIQQQQQQELQVSQAKADFLRLLNLNTDSTIVIADTIVIDNRFTATGYKDAILRNPGVLAAEQQIRVNELIVRELASNRLPALRLNGGFNFGRTQSAGQIIMNQSYGPFVGLSLTVPLYNGGAFKRQQQVAEINTRNATLAKENTIQNLNNLATRNFLAYQNSLKQLETEKQNYQLADSLLYLIGQRYQIGYSTILEVREAETSFINAGFRLVNLSYATKAAEIQLKRVAGQLTF